MQDDGLMISHEYRDYSTYDRHTAPSHSTSFSFECGNIRQAHLTTSTLTLQPNYNKKAMLREHKTSADPEDPDFGLPDPKRDPDRHQNCIT